MGLPWKRYDFQVSNPYMEVVNVQMTTAVPLTATMSMELP